MIPDDRLRLVFTCCHPALAREAQVALTLRLVCGLTTAEIAQAFLVPEPTMAARVTRAKKKISAARIAYRVPEAAELPDRLDAVLTVVHLLYTTGHTAPGGRRPGPRRPGRARARPGPDAARADAGRARGARPARAAPAHRRPAGDPAARRTAGCCCSRSRTGRCGTGAAIAEGIRAGPRGAARRVPGPVRAAGGDRRAARRGAKLRGDRLAADRPALRPAAAGPGRPPSSRSTGRSRWPWPTGPRPGWPNLASLEHDGRLAGYRYLPAARGRPAPPAGPGGRGRGSVPGRARAHGNHAERQFLARRLAEVRGDSGAAPADGGGIRGSGRQPPRRVAGDYGWADSGVRES